MKTALVLSGGSIKGSFQAGAIAQVLSTGFAPDAIHGTSVGSLNGGFLAERAGRAVIIGQSVNWSDIGQELEQFWRMHITSFSKIGKKRGTIKLLWSTIRNKFDGFIDTEPLRRLVYQEFKISHLRQSPIDFTACAVNVLSGAAKYGTAQDEDILDCIIASTAIPLIMPTTIIKEEPFVDGGIREVAPLARAIKEGAEKIIVIACQSKNLELVDVNHRNALELSDRLMAIATNELVNNDIEYCQFINKIVSSANVNSAKGPFAKKRFIDLIVIRPDKPLKIDLEKFTPTDIALAIELGRQKAEEILGNKQG